MSEEKVCCPKFDPTPWDEKEIVFDNKMFLKDSMPQFMHFPLPGAFGRTVAKMWKKIEESDAKTDGKDFLMLCYDPSPWSCEIYINTKKEIPGAENVKLSGNFLTKVFDGPYSNVPKWIGEMNDYASKKNKKIKKFYFYYTTCPKCAKKWGHNYVVVFAEV